MERRDEIILEELLEKLVDKSLVEFLNTIWKTGEILEWGGFPVQISRKNLLRNFWKKYMSIFVGIPEEVLEEFQQE